MNNEQINYTDDTTDYTQSLMYAAYDRWRSTPEIKGLAAMYESCSDAELTAVMIGNMNYQVENGGWSQWTLNGYREAAEEHGLETVLRDMDKSGKVTLAKRVLAMVRKVNGIAEDEDEHGRNTAWCECDDESEEYDEWGCQCGAEEDFDGWHDSPGREYYAINGAFMVQVEYYLRDKHDQPISDELQMAYDRSILAHPQSDEEIKASRKPKIRLAGTDSHALSIVGAARRVLRKAGYTPKQLKEFQKEALSGSYDHALGTVGKWCDIVG